MIKKLLFSLLFCLFGFIGFSYADYYISGSYSLPLDFGVNNSDLLIGTDGTFGNTFNNNFVGFVRTYDNRPSDYFYFWFWVDGKLYTLNIFNNQRIIAQGFFNKMGINRGSPTDTMNVDATSFYEGLYGTSFSGVYLQVFPNGYSSNLCFIDSSDNYYCFHSFSYEGVPGNLTGSLNYSFSSPNEVLNGVSASRSPFNGGGGGSSSGGSGGVIDLTDNDYIGYFENRSVESFNVSDCYVGTNDLTSPYGTAGLSFNYGKGKTIFDLYDSLYGSGIGSSYLNNVATWTRTWKLNYGNWFDRNAVGYMGVFSEFTLNGVEFLPRDYTGFIFSGRPASLYFMSNNLYDKFGFYGDTFELVGYCDMKLNGTPFNEVFLSGSATANNVLGITYSNYYNRQYYVDGSGNLVLSREPGDFNIYLSEWLNYNGTGEDYGDYFDGFSNFYDKLDEKFSNINLSNSVGIIPSYILFALFGIILFKIFKH